MRQSLLFISHRVPYPPDKGERARAFHHVKALAERFDVTVAAPTVSPAEESAAEQLRQYCCNVVTGPAAGDRGLLLKAGGLFRGKSATETYFQSPALKRALQQCCARKGFDLIVAYSSGIIPLALSLPAEARVADLCDVDSVKWSCYAKVSGWGRRWLYRREARLVEKLEEQAAAFSNAVVLISQAEVEMLKAQGSHIHAIANGVDLEYFNPTALPSRGSGGTRIVFTGSMDYRPNVDAMCWFAEQVWSGLRHQMPGLQCHIVGRNPTAAVRRLADLPGMYVTGTVPDVRPYMAAAQVAIAPLRIARGVQNKVLEAMAMGKAVVASPAAVEGLEALVGQEILQAQTPLEWQKQILSLLWDVQMRRRVEQAARRCVERNYSWQVRSGQFVKLCSSVLASKEADKTISVFEGVA